MSNFIALALISKILLTLTIVVGIVFYMIYGQDWPLFYADALGYYSYLPSAFIYHNFGSFETMPANYDIPNYVIAYFQSFKTDTPPAPTGNYMNRYTYGVALLQLPFFIVAHAYSYLAGLPMNGYTTVYQNIVRFSSLFYACAGLVVLYKLVSNYFKKELVIIALCLLLLGSNLFWFSFYQVGMSHSYLFFLHSCLLWSTYTFYKKPSTKRIFLLGFILGIIGITRQPDLIFGLVILFFGIFSFQGLADRIKFFFNNPSYIFIGLVGFIIPIFPQLLLWKIYAGSWLYFSYSGQGFDWLQPHIWEGLFGANNGWLIYAPLFLIAGLGLFFKKNISSFFTPIVLIVPLFMYVSYSWWCYWYMFGFGSRPMLSLYPLLVFPLTALVAKAAEWKLVPKAILIVTLLFSVFINLNITWAAVEERIQTDDTNYAFLRNTFYKQQLSVNDLIVLDCEEQQPQQDKLKKSKLGKHISFDTIQNNHIIYDSIRNTHFYKFDNGQEYSDIKFSKVVEEDTEVDFLQCSVNINNPAFSDQSPLLAISIVRNDSNFLWKAIKINNKLGWQEPYCKHRKLSIKHGHEGEWDVVSFFVKVPSRVLKAGDVIEFGVWNIPKKELYFDSLTMDCWTKKN